MVTKWCCCCIEFEGTHVAESVQGSIGGVEVEVEEGERESGRC